MKQKQNKEEGSERARERGGVLVSLLFRDIYALSVSALSTVSLQ